MTHRSRIVRRKRRTMRGGYDQFGKKGGRKRRSMRGGQTQTYVTLQEGEGRGGVVRQWVVSPVVEAENEGL
jgi:hypothetical protein